MAYLDTHARTTKPTSNDKFNQIGRVPAHFGVFVGFVKDAADVQKNGRLRVWIPEFGTTPDEEQGWIIVNYCSPFAGATNVETISKTDLESFEKTQTSYGMWMVPPDINNQVLVMFVGGDPARGIWIGSLFNQFMNNMIPGMASGPNSWQYPGKEIPLAEYNKWDKKVVQPDQYSRPFQKTKFKGVGNQGLITDQGRGVTTSSARRESPSNVFGIITPGPVVDTTAPPADIRRKGGSSFIMDDGSGSEYVELATKTGAKIRIDETNGFAYIINRDGTSWVQMDQKGNVSIFSSMNISMRAQQDINLRADRNINIEAGQNIFIKAAKDTAPRVPLPFTNDINNIPKELNIPFYPYKGEGNGIGGNIVIQALNDTHTTVKRNSYNTIEKNLDLNVGETIDISANTEYNLTSPSIRNVGAVKILGTLDVTGATKLGSTLGVVSSINGLSLSLSSGITAGTILGTFPGLRSGPGATNGGPGAAGPAVNIPTPPAVTPAEVKSLVQKINILPTWADEGKFKRNAESWATTVSVLATFEPNPEHENFSFSSVTGYTPAQTEGSKTYEGSGGAGGGATAPPATNTDPGANNELLPPTPAVESAVSKDFNMAAYECQLKIHEGVKYVSYLDSLGLPTGGIGHLLRANEIPRWPIGTPITPEQVTAWFQVDAPISISGAQRFLGMDTWSKLSDVRKRAVADLCYNMGEGRLSKFVRFKAAMQAGNYDAAGVSLRESLWYKQVATRGPKIIAMIVGNVDPNGCDKKFPAA